ncbi:MAG: hypothetical protein Q9M91_08280 [Candidatus Dojkabacteria bacterium]|nr:hypothetical protein [Candidatus Dojkabacteria bacterium]MDQ7021773.1 hypothetical protein [Candidatus Dojkabacteria bacterium]
MSNEKIDNVINETYLLKNKQDNTFISFGSFIASNKMNLGYFHNSGTHPDYRQKGNFTNLKNY